MTLAAALFALRVWATLGAHPLYALGAYGAAERHGVEPGDVVAMMVAEHSDSDSIGTHGERGLLQLGGSWRRAYNEAHGTAWTAADLHDPWRNLEVGAWAIARMQAKHGAAWTQAYQCAPGVRGTPACDTRYRDWLVARARPAARP